MTRLTRADERMVHQIPELLSTVATPDRHWRESYFFVAHQPDGHGDALVLTMASNPARQVMDSYQMGCVGTKLFFARTFRSYDGDPHTTEVGPVSVDILEPFRSLRLRVAETERTRVGFELTWTSRTLPYATRRGRLVLDGATVWDQRQIMQSGWFDGKYTVEGRTVPVRRWWGQRDHSWGVRHHARAPMWMWLAVQLPDGMLGAWCWEYPDGRRCFVDGCWAPADGGEPVPLADLQHDDLDWLDEAGKPVDYGATGEDVCGLGGRVVFVLADDRRVTVDGRGDWLAPYGRRGGGLHQLTVRTTDGRVGTAIYEITGAHHHRYFPVPRR